MDRHAGRPAAPPYDGEGPHALWHFSEDSTIEIFRPQPVAAGPPSDADDDFVWAVDTRHAPMFWFPRDCPRGCAWTSEQTTEHDRARFFGHTAATRIHVVEHGWLDVIRDCRLWAYRLPSDTFERHEVGGYWVTGETVEPIERVEVGDLLAMHAAAGIELRFTPSIWPWWADVAFSSLEFSGSRLRNCAAPMPEILAQL